MKPAFWSWLHVLVGVDNEALGIRNTVTQEDSRHAFTRAVLNAIARIDNKFSLVLKTLQLGDTLAFAAHGEHDRLIDFLVVELFLTIDVHLTAALAQLFGDKIKNGGVVANVIGRVSACAYNARNSNICHCYRLINYIGQQCPKSLTCKFTKKRNRTG